MYAIKNCQFILKKKISEQILVDVKGAYPHRCHDTLQQQNDRFVTVVEGLYCCNNLREKRLGGWMIKAEREITMELYHEK